MKKFAAFALISSFTLGACAALAAPTNAAPPVDVAGTANAIAQASVAQTLAAQPTPTAVPPTETFTPFVDQLPTLDFLATATPFVDLTTTPFTATSAPADLSIAPSATFTPFAAASVSPTASPTLGIRTYGTLPPANRPYTIVTLINKSRAEAYISLQVVTDQGYTIIEYPVERSVNVKIPTGAYTYVVWVGGRQFVGYFNVGKGSEPTITIFKDKVVVNQG